MNVSKLLIAVFCSAVAFSSFADSDVNRDVERRNQGSIIKNADGSQTIQADRDVNKNFSGSSNQKRIPARQ